MTFNPTRLLATTALVAAVVCATPALAEVVTERTTTTTSAPASSTTVRSTSTSTTPMGSTTRTIATTENNAATTVRKTTTAVNPADATVSTTVTTESAPVTTRSSVAWESKEKAIVPAGARVVNFMDFDLNKDGILSREEVGEHLFNMFDADGNEVIDNLEYARPAVLTVLPMEKETKVSYDFNGDGIAEVEDQKYETFLHYTQLTRFTDSPEGLSPRDFTGRGFLEADVSNDKFVDLKEFKGSYNAALDDKNKRAVLTDK